MGIKGLAIDPGTHHLGYVFFDLNENRLTLSEYGSFRVSRKPLEHRLHQIFVQAQEWMRHRPLDVLVVEHSMSNRHFPGGGETVRESLGVLKVAAVQHNLQIVLLRPHDAKWAVTGKAAASKLEVAAGVERAGVELPFAPETLVKKKLDHITDAIALAIAYALTRAPFLELYDRKGVFLCGLSKPEPRKKNTKKATNGNNQARARNTGKPNPAEAGTTTKRKKKSLRGASA